MQGISELLDDMLADPRHGWSIGTFGAIGEFVRDDDEAVTLGREGEARTIVTQRGGMRIVPDPALRVVAYDTLSSDGETWGQSISFCLAEPAAMEQGKVQALGQDVDALRPDDRDMSLFDLGAGRGHVRFCLRTRDEGLIAVLTALDGLPMFGPEGRAAMSDVLRAQPQRVLLSPIGRVEVYSLIPEAGGSSPEGPHTHLLPKLLASGRTHAANAPIPGGMQPVLMLHPRSPWRDGLGRRVDFDEGLDDLFENLFAQFGLREDIDVRCAVEDAVEEGISPEAFSWPTTRRGRAEARITLRRMARTGSDRNVMLWRQHYDRVADPDPDEAALLHA